MESLKIQKLYIIFCYHSISIDYATNHFVDDNILE